MQNIFMKSDKKRSQNKIKTDIEIGNKNVYL